MSHQELLSRDFHFQRFEKLQSQKAKRRPLNYSGVKPRIHGATFNYQSNSKKKNNHKRTIIHCDDKKNTKNDSFRPTTAPNMVYQATKMPMFLQRKKLKQEIKEQEVKEKYFKKFQVPNESEVTIGKNHEDFIEFKKSLSSGLNTVSVIYYGFIHIIG